jgi:spermidine synthase
MEGTMRTKLFYNVGGYSVWTVPELPKGKTFWAAGESIANRQDCLAVGISKASALKIMKAYNKAVDKAVSCDTVNV